MTTAHAFFHAASGRWDIADDAWAGRSALQQVADGLWIGRRPDGSVAEITLELGVADEGAVNSAIESVRSSFGETFANAIASPTPVSDREISTTEDVTRVPSMSRVPTVPGEPGVPVPRDAANQFEIPLPGHQGELSVRHGHLDFRVTGPHAEWVRISDGESGVLLALGPLRDAMSHQETTVAFALRLTPEELHISITNEPTQPVGDRRRRLYAWSKAMIDGAARDARRRPGRAAATAEHAARIADHIGDQDLSRQAHDVADQSRRRHRWRLAGLAAAVIALLALIVALPRLLDGGSGTPPAGRAFYENCDAARAAGAAPIARGEPGYRAALDRDGDGVACEV